MISKKEDELIKHLKIINLDTYPDDFYLNEIVRVKPIFKKAICKLARLNNLQKNKVGNHHCPFKENEYECKDCPGLFDSYINKKNEKSDIKKIKRATASCLADALGIKQQTLGGRINSEHFADLSTINTISYLADCSILELLKLPDDYLFTKNGVVVNVGEKYSIPELGKKLRTAKKMLVKSKIDITIDKLITQLNVIDCTIEKFKIEEIFDSYIF